MLPRLLNAPIFPHIAVLFGDRGRPDSVRPNGALTPIDIEDQRVLKAALDALPGYRFSYISNHATLAADLQKLDPDLVLNFCDEGYGNDPAMEPHIPALLEMLHIPYTGAGPACLAKCYDKSLVGAVAKSLDIPVPAEKWVSAENPVLPDWHYFPALVKLNRADNSVSIDEGSIVKNKAELAARLTHLQRHFHGRDIVVQEYLPGTEYNLMLLGNAGNHQFLQAFEWDFSEAVGLAPIITYAEKYDMPDSPYHGKVDTIPANLSADQLALLQNYAMRLAQRLESYDYAKFDFRAAADGTIKLIEVNPNPSWGSSAFVDKNDTRAGLQYGDIIRFILESAQLRYRPIADLKAHAS